MDPRAGRVPRGGFVRGDRSLKLALAIETALRPGAVAVGPADPTDPSSSHGRTLSAERSHARDLLPAIEALLAQAQQGPEARFESIVVGVGPGSYTGLRVGIALAQGLARAQSARLVGLPSFAWMAFAELAPGEQGWFVNDARAGAFHAASYARTEDGLRTLVAPCIVPYGELGTRLGDAQLLFGDERALETAAEAGIACASRALPEADARALLALARAEDAGTSACEVRPAEPLYLREFGS